jgi:hypothetical protein
MSRLSYSILQKILAGFPSFSSAERGCPSIRAHAVGPELRDERDFKLLHHEYSLQPITADDE